MFAAEGVLQMLNFALFRMQNIISHIMSHLRFQRVSMLISTEDLRVNEHFNYMKKSLTCTIHRHEVTLWVRHDKPFKLSSRRASTEISSSSWSLHLHLQL